MYLSFSLFIRRRFRIGCDGRKREAIEHPTKKTKIKNKNKNKNTVTKIEGKKEETLGEIQRKMKKGSG